MSDLDDEELKATRILNGVEKMCEYCEEAVPLKIGKTNDYGIVIRYPNYLEAYGYNVHGMGSNGMGSNGLEVKINYCPMCGRRLGE